MNTTNLCFKRQISYRKFNRIKTNTTAKSCRSYRYRVNNYSPEASNESYVLGDFCYVKFLVNKGTDRLTPVYMRYWVGTNERADNFAFVLNNVWCER